MKKMKTLKRKTYFFIISFIITACITGGFFGVCVAYENTVKIAYGEYKKAVEIDGGKIRIFDFDFNLA